MCHEDVSWRQTNSTSRCRNHLKSINVVNLSHSLYKLTSNSAVWGIKIPPIQTTRVNMNKNMTSMTWYCILFLNIMSIGLVACTCVSPLDRALQESNVSIITRERISWETDAILLRNIYSFTRKCLSTWKCKTGQYLANRATKLSDINLKTKTDIQDLRKI